MNILLMFTLTANLSVCSSGTVSIFIRLAFRRLIFVDRPLVFNQITIPVNCTAEATSLRLIQKTRSYLREFIYRSRVLQLTLSANGFLVGQCESRKDSRGASRGILLTLILIFGLFIDHWIPAISELG
ncbi:hypothetical protein V1527DRAFT_472292 [Lipomyces starkeyi]